MEIPEGLEIRESPIHGLGVFATRNFAEGEVLGEFTGVVMTRLEFAQKYGTDYRYSYRQMRANRIIVAKEQRNFITYVNDGVYGAAVPHVNVCLRNKKLCVIRPIEAGEELLMDYGSIYNWKTR